MLWLAGLLGLVAFGGAAIADFSVTAEEDENIESDTPEPREQDEDSTTVGDMLATLDHPEASGSQTSQVITGTSADDSLTSGNGADQINGYGGDDTLTGGSGRDVLTGSDGADLLFGEAGDDTLHGSYGSDTLLGGSEDDQLYGLYGDDLIQGEEGNDTAHGGQDQDRIYGGDGNDALHGNSGNDTLAGGDGTDTLFGGYGDDLVIGTDDDADFLNGGDGNDTIVAGQGDIVTSGTGEDSIALNLGTEKLSAPTVLMDFDNTEDRLLMIMDPGGEQLPDIAIEDDPTIPAQKNVFVNGALVAAVHGAESLAADDILLVDSATAEMWQTQSR